MGFDCSGLVQSVLKICGLPIPRDSKDQRLFLKNDQIDIMDAEPGDSLTYSSAISIFDFSLIIGKILRPNETPASIKAIRNTKPIKPNPFSSSVEDTSFLLLFLVFFISRS